VSHCHRHRKIRKDDVCGSGDILADRQTDKQTCSSQYFASAPAGEVTMLTMHIQLHSQLTLRKYGK